MLRACYRINVANIDKNNTPRLVFGLLCKYSELSSKRGVSVPTVLVLIYSPNRLAVVALRASTIERQLLFFYTPKQNSPT